MSSLLKKKPTIIALILALLLITGCSSSNDAGNSNSTTETPQVEQSQTYTHATPGYSDDPDEDDLDDNLEDDEIETGSPASASSDSATSTQPDVKDNSSGSSTKTKGGVPSVLKGKWESQSGGLYYTSNSDPDFSSSLKKKRKSFEKYSSLDYLGRCGTATACIGLDIMPTGGRESISGVKPTGWHTYKYDFINGGYLYNRCHLIAFSLAGENANERNLITGTRQMNETMIEFENIVSTYVTWTGNHCLYRVTPIFLGKELVARGVHMEAFSVEDAGGRVKYNVYIPNKQSKVKINYSTGESSLIGNAKSSGSKSDSKSGSNGNRSSNKSASSNKDKSSKSTTTTYVLNTSSKKFHYPYCSSVKRMSDKNKAFEKGTRSSIIKRGFDPCGICHP